MELPILSRNYSEHGGDPLFMDLFYCGTKCRTVTIRRFRSDWLNLHPVKKCREFYSRKWRGRFKFWTLDNLCFHPPRSSWNRYERQEQRGAGDWQLCPGSMEYTKGLSLVSSPSPCLTSLQWGSLGRDHDPWVHVLNKRNWRKCDT